MPRPVPGQPAHGYQPAAPGYQSAAPQPPTPPVPGQQNQPSQPGFQHGAPPQPGAPWPVGQPPTPPRSAHEGFTSVTLGGDRGPRDGLAAPQYSPDSHADDTYRLPPRGEIGPGPGGYLPGPEQGGQ